MKLTIETAQVIRTVPSNVFFTCDSCGEEIEIHFDQMSEELPNSWFDWEGEQYSCPLCGCENTIEDVDYHQGA